MRNHLLTVILCLVSIQIINAQSISIPVSELEKSAHSKFFNLKNDLYGIDDFVDVKFYGLNLKITYNPHQLIGDVSIDATSLVNNLDSVFYNFSNNLLVDSVHYLNQKIPFHHTQNRISVRFTNPININQLISLRIFYHGIPVPTGFGSFIFGTHDNDLPAIWTLSEPYGASDWFPCKNVPSDKADSSHVEINCNKNLIPVSNGNLTEVVNHGDGTHTYKWHNSYPIADYLISLAIADYSQYNFYFKYSQTDSMPVVNYIYPENLNDDLKLLLDRTNYMLGLFSQKFGLYPFINEKYGHAEFGRNGGMEHQTISSMGVFNENIIAHELAHQWFGDKITCRDWQNIWLNEGFATYGEAIYQENAYGQEAYDAFIIASMSGAKTAVGSVYVQDVNSISEIFSGNRSYSKGCVILHMLRGIAGDSVFFEILKSYSNDPGVAYKTAVTEDFQRVAEKVSGLELDYFFQQWIFGENYPKYDVSWTAEQSNNNQFIASINISQRPNTNPVFFTMPLQIKIFTQSGDTVFTVFNNMQSQTFSFSLNSMPLNFKIDPGNFILKDVYGENIVPVSFELLQNFPNPFNPTTTIAYNLGKPANVTITIYDVLGKEIQTFKNEKIREGNYTIEFNAAGLSSGIYFYSIRAMDFENINLLFEETRRMVYVK